MTNLEKREMKVPDSVIQVCGSCSDPTDRDALGQVRAALSHHLRTSLGDKRPNNIHDDLAFIDEVRTLAQGCLDGSITMVPTTEGDEL